jgi:hypothetical protein
VSEAVEAACAELDRIARDLRKHRNGIVAEKLDRVVLRLLEARAAAAEVTS